MIDYDFKKAYTFEDAINNLYEIIKILRSENGCPHDKGLKSKDSLSSLIEEAYEYLDGVNQNNISSCKEEIGDVLINALMILRIHEENGDFLPHEALNDVCEKLIRRHPHVFKEQRVDSEAEGMKLYYQEKAKEGYKNDPESVLNHIPSSFPPLERSYEIQKKLAKFSFDWPNVSGVIDKIKEELSEVEEAIIKNDKDNLEEEIGDLLTSVVNLSRYVKVRPNIALERTNNKIKSRFIKLFKICEERDIKLEKKNVDLMNDVWNEIKEDEKLLLKKKES